MKYSNLGKALGEDWFVGKLLLDKDVGSHLRKQLLHMLNTDSIPSYLKRARKQLIFKTNKTTVAMDDVRPIAKLPQIMKVLEKTIKNKLEKLGSKMLKVGPYYTGFLKGLSTKHSLARMLNEVMRTRIKRSQRKVYLAIDLSKAYDNISRKHLFNFLQSRVSSPEDQ